MEKKRILEAIQSKLAGELASLKEASRAAHEAATHEESKPEDAHDTRAIEAGYLAGAAAKRAAELEQALNLFRNVQFRDFGPTDAIAPGALVELEHEGKRALYLLSPQGGGLTLKLEATPVHIITTKSPLGDELMGRKNGETALVETPSGDREYQVLSVR